MKYLKYFEHRKSTTRNYNIDNIIYSYLEAALFTEADIEDLYDLSVYDISDKSKEEIEEEIEWFIYRAGGIINQMSDEKLGHDLWYTRNGHGTGFWDNEYPKHDSDLLGKLSEVLGNAHIYNNDGEIEQDSSVTYKEWDFEKYKERLKYQKNIEKYNL